MHIHEQSDWSEFRWCDDELTSSLADLCHRQGRLIGRMSALGFELQSEAVLATPTQDVVKPSEIEGENLPADQVRSSIARRLGMDIGGLETVDHHIEGIVEMMLDATRGYALSLHPAKTRLLEFGRFAASNRAGRGLGKPETFNFLGFTLICGRSRWGKFVIRRETQRERLGAKLKEIKKELR